MALKTIDGSMLKEMYLSGCALLNQNRESVDALNVFPVPDGDTGTNMSQTMNAAAKELNARPFSSVGDVANAVARGALKGARGNSGVILSQIFRGIASALEGHDEMDAELLVKAMRSGAQTAYKAVMKPKEGTILTVARVIAEELESFIPGHDDIIEVFGQLMASGEAILKKTPDMLPVLKQAGVVDSGGKGLMVIYAGFYSALTGTPVENVMEGSQGAKALPGDFVDDHENIEDITFGYCTELLFLIRVPISRMRMLPVSGDVLKESATVFWLFPICRLLRFMFTPTIRARLSRWRLSWASWTRSRSTTCSRNTESA